MIILSSGKGAKKYFQGSFNDFVRYSGKIKVIYGIKPDPDFKTKL